MISGRSAVIVAFVFLSGILNVIFLLNLDFSKGGDAKPFQHEVAGLSCENYGGPSDEIASEMVYWSDIPKDAEYVSPFKKYGPKTKYLTYEIDEGGWNNIRMSMETAVALAVAMGRTLVMPPAQKMYLIDEDENGQKNRFGFNDFFHFDSIAAEHAGLEIISTQEFLEREIMTGNIRSKSGSISLPPGNRTDWSGMMNYDASPLEEWMRNEIAETPKWNMGECIAVFPEKPGPGTSSHLLDMLDQILNKEGVDVEKRIERFTNRPTPVDAPTIDRMREQLSYRRQLCIYDEELQQASVVHFGGDNDSGLRLLAHFYVYLFFEDWKQDLWTKRFVRDHIRYVDEIQCAAARVVDAVRTVSKENGNKIGVYDSFHIRRGDFQYEDTRVEASVINENVKDVFEEGSTVYIATDERDQRFFDPLRQHYKIYFMDDFIHLLDGVNTNYYGMLDQLIASRGRTFSGTFDSTFTGYINRMRGYHSQKEKMDGFRKGRLRSYYSVPEDCKHEMTSYIPLRPAYWEREFPVSWRDIDKGVN